MLSLTKSSTSRWTLHNGENVNDPVAVDAKRILLRYGAPIVVLDKIPEARRIEFARAIIKTELAGREPRLRELLVEHGYIEES